MNKQNIPPVRTTFSTDVKDTGNMSRCSIDNGLPANVTISGEHMEPDDVAFGVKHVKLGEHSTENNTQPTATKRPSDLEAALETGRLDLADYFWRAHHAHCRNISLNSFDLMKSAIQSRKFAVVRFLTERNISVICSNEDGETPLHLAAQLGTLDIVEFLATSGAQIDAVDCHNNTPLHMACIHGRTKSVMALCGVRASLNIFNDENRTPLLCAVHEGYRGCTRILVNAGARTDVTDQEGNAPIHIATLRNDNAIVQILCKSHAALDSLNSGGYNALNLAAKLGHLQVARTLLLYGADPGIKSPNGVTPDVVAFAQGHKEVGMLLTRMKPEKRKKWCEQLLDTNYPIPRIKIKLFGSTMTGKTQLTTSLRAGSLSAFLRKKLNSVGELAGFTVEQITRRRTCQPDEWEPEVMHENYTRGFDVHITNEYTLWDFSGYNTYFFLYDNFIGDTNCIHLVLFSLLDRPEWRRASVQFWLNFLYARIAPSGPLMFRGRPINMGRVVLVGTYADCVQCTRDSNACYVEDDATEMLHEMRKKYESKLDICPSVFLLNARDATSLEMKQLKARLTDWRTEIIQGLPRTNALLTEVASLIPEWTADMLLQLETWDRFADRVRENVNPLCSEEHVETLVQHLQYTGNVIAIESPSSNNMIALNPQWLGIFIIGRMFSSNSLQNARITGSYTVDDLQLFVRAVNTVNLVLLLEALGVAVCCVVRDEPVVEQIKRRSRNYQNSGKTDFFDQASQHFLDGSQSPATNHQVSVYLATELVRNMEHLNLDDVQLEVPRYNAIPMSIPPWESVSDPRSMRFLGFQLSTERGQMLHLMPRLQVHLRISVADFFTKGRWNRAGEENKPSFRRWEMVQMKNATRIIIYEGAIEVAAALSEDGQSLQLLARSAVKHVRKTFSLMHQLISEISDHIHSICPSLLISGAPLYASDLASNQEMPAAWGSKQLIDAFRKLHQRTVNTEQKKAGPTSMDLEPENQLFQDLFLGDERILREAMSCYQLPLTALRFPVVHHLAHEIDCFERKDTKLEEFVKAMGITSDPEEYVTLVRKGHFAPHTISFFESVIHAEQISSTANTETLVNALEVFQSFHLTKCIYQSHLLLRLFTRRNVDS
ncbi:Death-associated protein kinase [Fasciola hepatica]|uniref:Death-associated protein kinase n=1 Tax=Fasciola hepatica TaxID=6192 RepID=A0A4E0RE71_FASHE|nr:Death-associated protein kinase [Fasciola hepatica]